MNIRFEKVGDVNLDFPFLEVFLVGNKCPFMEISVSSDKNLCFKIYSNNDPTDLNLNLWKEILSVSQDFLSEVIKDEEDHRNFMNEFNS